MKKIRAILVGIMIWTFVFILFSILDFIPSLKNKALHQFIIVAVLVIPYTLFSAFVYYKNGNSSNGLTSGLIMVTTALILDIIITVPFIIIPNKGSYYGFFTSIYLWLLVIENLMIVYLYWRMRVKMKTFIS